MNSWKPGVVGKGTAREAQWGELGQFLDFRGRQTSLVKSHIADILSRGLYQLCHTCPTLPL